jgi:hypothetical protein
MSFLKKLTKTAIDIATTPLAVASDIATLGGLLTDQDDPYTVQKLRQLKEDAEEVRDALDD